MTVKVVGLAQFRTKLKTMDRELLHGKLGAIVLDASQVLVTQAQANVLSRSTVTGALAAGIHAELQPAKTPHDAAVHIGPAGKTFYGRFVETGTKFAGAEPYLGPAFASTRDQILRKIQDGIIRIIERVAGGQ